jgi:hypothetical protein
MMRLSQTLRPLMPEGLDTFFFSNSGAEAVEASIKLARHATKRPNIVANRPLELDRPHRTQAPRSRPHSQNRSLTHRRIACFKHLPGRNRSKSE